MSAFVTWHGSQAESVALCDAIQRHCGCERGPFFQRVGPVCSAHRLLSESQRALDGLVFARRIRARLIAEEQTATCAAVRALAGQP